MTEFLAILSIYYLCDATAAVRPMGMAEVQACTHAYDTVKTYFVTEFELAAPGTLDRFTQMQAAYLAFQAWEDSNPELVARMRAEAWGSVTGAG